MSLKVPAAAVVMFSASAILLARQGSPAASAVLDAERRWTQALVKGDVEALGRLVRRRSRVRRGRRRPDD
jgi:hypothetical protein